MKKKFLKKAITLAVMGAMCASMCILPTMAQEDGSVLQGSAADMVGRTIGSFSFSINGTTAGRTGDIVKTRNGNAPGGCYRVNLDHNQGTGPGYDCVMNSHMRNCYGEDRGFGQTYQGTANTIYNTGSAGYLYHLECTRQYESDVQGVTFSGTWSPDEY